MSDSLFYSPAEVCELYGISKSTLLRWERAGIISSVNRDLNDQRLYTQKNICEIGELQKANLKRQFSRITQMNDRGMDDPGMAERAYEALSLWKFMQGNASGLEDLENYPRLSIDTIRKLSIIALPKYHPTSPVFHRIAKVVAKQSEHLSKERESAEEG